MNIEQLNSAAPEILTEAPAGITSETLNSLVETYCRAIATREDLYAEYMKGTTRAEQIADAIRDFLAKHGLNEESCEPSRWAVARRYPSNAQEERELVS